MRRHVDLIRTILLEVEKSQSIGKPITVTADGYTPEEVNYHVMLLHEAGFVEALDFSSHNNGFQWRPTRLTWPGHEFLDAARADTVWQKVKSVLTDKGIDVPLGVVHELAVQIGRSMLGLACQRTETPHKDNRHHKACKPSSIARGRVAFCAHRAGSAGRYSKPLRSSRVDTTTPNRRRARSVVSASAPATSARIAT
jgi:hypothetical protein